MNDDHHMAAPGEVSWQCRIVQRAMKRLIKPRLTLAHGVPTFRRTLDRAAMFLPRPPRGITIVQASCGGIPGEWIRHAVGRPASAPVILHFHGGAFVAGSPRLSRGIVTQTAQRCGADAFSVDYRLAPEHPCPAAIEDAGAAYRGLVDGGIAPARIVVSGESAGAALALVLATKIRDGTVAAPLPRALVLISPWLDLTLSGPRLLSAPEMDPALPAALMADARHLYVPGGDFGNPCVSPLFAKLEGLPPVLVQAGGREILLDDARRLGARLAQAGVVHRIEEWGGMHHVWHHAPFKVPEAERAFAAIASFISGIGAAGRDR